MKTLSISIIIPTYNSTKTLEDLLKSVREQVYDQKKIEILLSDGGSKDKIEILAKKYNANIIKVQSDKQGAEYNRAVGVYKAKNEILLFLDHDNFLPHKKWITKMIEPFLLNKEVIGVETLHYTYDKREPLLGRYFSLFGVNDVLPFYLGKADRLSYIFDNPGEYGVFKKGKVIKKKGYFLIYFNKNNIPTLGSNGFLVKRKLLLAKAKSGLDNFFHIDVNVDLIKSGLNCYAFVNDSIVHRTNERGIVDYFRRRKLFMLKYGFVDISRRRYSVYEKKDFYALLWFIFIAATFVKPTYDAIRGFIKIHDIAWFLHPFICFGTLLIYSYAVIRITIKK